jgi:hypothetical protein
MRAQRGDMVEEPERVPLDRLAVDWVQPSVCEDTFENRRALRENGNRWRVVPPEQDGGPPTGLVEVVTAQTTMARMQDRFRDCLADPRDPWSDYVDPRLLPMDVEGVPYWVHRRAQRHAEWEASTGKPTPDGPNGVPAKAHAGKEPYLPTRCDAVKVDGTRCWAWAADGAVPGKCRSHAPGAWMAANAGHNIAVARMRILQALPAVADQLEELALGAASEQVRLKASTEIMDRGGVLAGHEVTIGGELGVREDPGAAIRGRLAELSRRIAAAEEARDADPPDVVDADVVGEEGSP